MLLCYCCPTSKWGLLKCTDQGRAMSNTQRQFDVQLPSILELQVTHTLPCNFLFGFGWKSWKTGSSPLAEISEPTRQQSLDSKQPKSPVWKYLTAKMRSLEIKFYASCVSYSIVSVLYMMYVFQVGLSMNILNSNIYSNIISIVKIDIRLWKKNTFVSGCTAWRVRYRSQESYWQTSLTAENEMWQKLWQMQMAERKTKWQKVQSPTRQQSLDPKQPKKALFGNTLQQKCRASR